MSRKAVSMQGYGDNFIPVIPIEDEPLHTPMNPFCYDITCGCHEEQESLFTPQEATNFVAGKTL